jgi:hypothetical protein
VTPHSAAPDFTGGFLFDRPQNRFSKKHGLTTFHPKAPWNEQLGRAAHAFFEALRAALTISLFRVKTGLTAALKYYSRGAARVARELGHRHVKPMRTDPP